MIIIAVRSDGEETVSHRHPVKGILLFLLAMLIPACTNIFDSSDDDTTTPPSGSQPTVGAAGGTVSGPDGVTVTVPAGALGSDIALSVSADATGAPALPAGAAQLGSIYQFTPHGTSFDLPATASIPFDPAGLPAGAEPMFMFAEPGEEWVYLANAAVQGDTISAPLLGFSYGNVWIGNVNSSGPKRLGFELVAPGSLPTYGNSSIPLIEQPTTLTLRVTADPAFVAQRCASIPTVELARAIKTVTDNTPPPSWAYTPLETRSLGSGLVTEFQVPIDHTHNGTVWFIGKFDCALNPGPPVDGYPWFLFGFVWARVDIPAPGPPVFTTQPQSVTVTEGQAASFAAVAEGNPQPSVQWYRVGSPDVAVGTATPPGAGSTSSTYTTPALTLADSGTQYYAVAESAAGNAQSNVVTVTVDAGSGVLAPSILVHPADQTVAEGGTATFEVQADGTPTLTYQWRRDGADIAGANSEILVLTNVQLSENGKQFDVVVSNTQGDATSDPATLTVTSAAGWGAAQRVDNLAGEAWTPWPAIDPNGNATVVWSQNDGSRYNIHANRYTAGGGWGTPEIIEDVAASSGDPVVGMDSVGNAMAAWGAVNNTAYFNRYTAGGGWGTAGALASLSTGTHLAVEGGGDAFAVWQQYSGASDDIYASRFSASAWGTPQLLESGGGAASNPKVATDGSGNAIAVWRQNDGSTYSIYANRYVAGSGWGAAQTIESSSSQALVPEIAMSSSGEAVVAWSEDDGGTHSVHANRYDPGTGWGTAQELDPGTADATNPRAAIDGSGNAVVIWRQYDGSGHRIYARHHSPGGNWSAVVELQSPSGGDAWEPDVAMNSSGEAIAAWVQWQSTTFGIFANRYTPGIGWGGAELVADATDDAGGPRIAVNDNGDAVVVWQQNDGSGYQIWASRK